MNGYRDEALQILNEFENGEMPKYVLDKFQDDI